MPYQRDTAQYLVVKKPDSVPLTYTDCLLQDIQHFLTYIDNITTIHKENRS